MGQAYSLKIVNKDSGKSQEYELLFSNDELEILRDFITEAERLEDSAWVRSGMNVELSVKYVKDKGLQFKSKLPPWDDVIVVLHKLRPFTLNNETTNFNCIRNMLAKKCKSPEFRASLRYLKDLYAGKCMQKGVRFETGNRILNSESTLDDWLNSFEYHRDSSKRQAFEEINQVFPEDFSKGVFLNLIVERFKSIQALAFMINSILNPEGTCILTL